MARVERLAPDLSTVDAPHAPEPPVVEEDLSS
jgi:hypothetical protein